MSEPRTFPDGFLWGASTSAYQVEGSPLADGAGPSNWHRFCRTPGLVKGGDTGDVACDHYRRWKDDIGSMKELGLNAYRFSISWSRVLPEGTGTVNEKGLDFYRRLVDALGEAGIEPKATLFHWDLPAALEDRGGWQNRDIAGWFAEYARVVFRALDGRVRMWATLNEPWVVTDGGYLHGVLAPGHRSLFEAPIAAHNLLRAHGAAVDVYRAEGKHRIGVVVNLEPKHPASESPEDLAAARRADAYMNRQFLDPLLLGHYPEELVGIFGEAWPEFPAADLDAIRRPIDFLGVNYYSRGVVRNEPKAWPVGAGSREAAGAAHRDGLGGLSRTGSRRSCCGCASGTASSPSTSPRTARRSRTRSRSATSSRIPSRVAYLRDHLLAVRRAIDGGVDVRGYFAWSLLDNFEWSQGFSKRFGLIRVDYATQKRTAKASARYYTKVIRSNGAALEE